MSAVLICPFCGRQLYESNGVELIRYGNRAYHVELTTIKCDYCGTNELATGWGKFYKDDNTEAGKKQEEKEPEKFIGSGEEQILNPKWVDRNPLYKALIYSDITFPYNVPKWRSAWYLRTHRPKLRIVLGGVLYDTDYANLLTTDDWHDKNKTVRTYYYRMPRGDYFSIQVGDGQKDHFRRMSEMEIQSKLGKIAPDIYLKFFPIGEKEEVKDEGK